MNDTIFKATRNVIDRAMALSIMTYAAAREKLGNTHRPSHLIQEYGTCKLSLGNRTGKTTWIIQYLPDPEATVVVAQHAVLTHIKGEVIHAGAKPALAYVESIRDLQRLAVDSRVNALVKHIVVDEYMIFDGGQGLSFEFYTVAAKFPNLQCIVALGN